MAYGSIPENGTKDPSYSFYNMPHKGASILSLDPSTLSDHFTTTMVNIYPYGAWLLIIAPMGITHSTLSRNNVKLPLPFSGGNYPIVLLDDIYL